MISRIRHDLGLAQQSIACDLFEQRLVLRNVLYICFSVTYGRSGPFHMAVALSKEDFDNLRVQSLTFCFLLVTSELVFKLYACQSLV